MGTFMFHTIRSLRKTSMTNITFEWSFAGMNSSMDHHLAGRSIPMTAQITSVRQHFNGVRFIVFDHNIFYAKSFTTSGARKWQFTRMHSHMIG